MKKLLGIVLLVVLFLGLAVGLVCVLYFLKGIDLLQSILVVGGAFGGVFLFVCVAVVAVFLLLD